MACDIGKGRSEPCKDSVGGIKALYFANYQIFADYDLTNPSSIADLSSVDDFVAPDAVEFFKWDVKGATNLEQTLTSSRDSGTTYFEQVLNATFKKLDAETQEEILAIAQGRPQIVVHDYNGNAFLMGNENGTEATGGTIVTGTAMADLSGYTLVMTGQERKPANMLIGSTLSDPFAGLTTPPTISTEVIPTTP